MIHHGRLQPHAIKWKELLVLVSDCKNVNAVNQFTPVFVKLHSILHTFFSTLTNLVKLASTFLGKNIKRC